MSEAFLHYVWQFQYFDKHELQTTSGDPIQIFQSRYPKYHMLVLTSKMLA